MSITVNTIEIAGLGDRSYLIHDGRAAFVIDPPRDIEQILMLARDQQLEIEMIFETHLHNDYVSGGLALRRRTGATVGAAHDDQRSFEVQGLAHRDRIDIGQMTVEVRHSPGHTHTHLSYVVHADGRVRAVFTGGSLLYGTVGRTDLLGDAETDELTRQQWQTVRSMVDDLPDDTDVYPTHGFGSFCSAQAGADRTTGTIGDEQDNLAVTTDDVDVFVSDLLAGLTDIPSYYAHMSHLNRAGMAEPDLSPATEVDIDELAARLEAGEWVIDLRGRRAYAQRHLIGTFNFEADGLPTHLGWLMPWGTRLTLLASDTETIMDAQRSMCGIGVDRPSRADLDAGFGTLPTTDYPVITYRDLAAMPTSDRRGHVLDVRRVDEFETHHLEGAINTPLHQLLDHLHHVPDGPLWVHCGSGARAGIATSILARAGYDVTLVDGGPE